MRWQLFCMTIALLLAADVCCQPALARKPQSAPQAGVPLAEASKALEKPRGVPQGWQTTNVDSTDRSATNISASQTAKEKPHIWTDLVQSIVSNLLGAAFGAFLGFWFALRTDREIKKATLRQDNKEVVRRLRSELTRNLSRLGDWLSCHPLPTEIDDYRTLSLEFPDSGECSAWNAAVHTGKLVALGDYDIIDALSRAYHLHATLDSLSGSLAPSILLYRLVTWQSKIGADEEARLLEPLLKEVLDKARDTLDSMQDALNSLNDAPRLSHTQQDTALLKTESRQLRGD